MPSDRGDSLQFSLLDRLLDDEPDNLKEVPRNKVQALREIKESVRRDLQNLLNTRTYSRGWPEQYTELNSSLLNYGLPDFGGLSTLTVERETFRQLIEDTIRCHEPRFVEVKVQLVGESNLEDRTLQFRIDVLLHAEPSPERIVLDSRLETIDGSIDVEVTQR